jgi:hypothetical protein
MGNQLILSDLTFGESIWVSVVNVLLTAAFVAFGATYFIAKFQSDATARRQQEQLSAAEQRRQADADAAARRQQADGDAAARRQQADADAAARRQQADADASERRLELEAQHAARLQQDNLEYQTRAFLRDTYALLLGAQRRSRQASLALARGGGESRDTVLFASAVQAHDSFIELYHRLNLDASRTMWNDARSLRRVLDKMLEEGQAGNPEECERLQEIARHARQNLEGSFRDRLRHEVLQPRKDVEIQIRQA